jgi:hypothetical protein
MAHASAGVSAWSHVGGPSGVRNCRDELRAATPSGWTPIAVCDVAAVADEGRTRVRGIGLDLATFDLLLTRT